MSVETSFNNFVSGVVVTRLIPVLAAFFVLKAVLGAAQGQNPSVSVVCDLLVGCIEHGPVDAVVEQRFRVRHDGHAGFDLEFPGGNDPAGSSGNSRCGAILNYARHRPFVPLIGSGLAFLSVSALWKLVQAMAGG